MKTAGTPRPGNGGSRRGAGAPKKEFRMVTVSLQVLPSTADSIKAMTRDQKRVIAAMIDSHIAKF